MLRAIHSPEGIVGTKWARAFVPLCSICVIICCLRTSRYSHTYVVRSISLTPHIALLACARSVYCRSRIYSLSSQGVVKCCLSTNRWKDTIVIASIRFTLHITLNARDGTKWAGTLTPLCTMCITCCMCAARYCHTYVIAWPSLVPHVTLKKSSCNLR